MLNTWPFLVITFKSMMMQAGYGLEYQQCLWPLIHCGQTPPEASLVFTDSLYSISPLPATLVHFIKLLI